MAEILINADEVRSCVKYKSGKVCIWLDGVKEIREVPTHGDLIERDKLPQNHITDHNLKGHSVVDLEDVQNAPTIIEASN